VLTPLEIQALLEAVPGPKAKAAMAVAYGAGLRASEVVNLRAGDIDSTRMLLRVEQGKGQKDRHPPGREAPPHEPTLVHTADPAARACPHRTRTGRLGRPPRRTAHEEPGVAADPWSRARRTGSPAAFRRIRRRRVHRSPRSRARSPAATARHRRQIPIAPAAARPSRVRS
jgi:hypothetical protein